MTQTTEAELVVSQEDRDAAAPFAFVEGSVATYQLRHDIREGRRDGHTLVQAFARHRQRAMTQAADAAYRRGVEDAAKVAECHFDDRPRRDSFNWNDGYMDACRGAAVAIRNLTSGERAGTCPSCGGLNTACPDGCERDPATGELA